MKKIDKLAKNIKFNCCNHGNKHEGEYKIGYVGYKFCTVAICVDCGERQIICGKIGTYFLRKFLRKGIRQVIFTDTVTIKDSKIFG